MKQASIVLHRSSRGGGAGLTGLCAVSISIAILCLATGCRRQEEAAPPRLSSAKVSAVVEYYYRYGNNPYSLGEDGREVLETTVSETLARIQGYSGVALSLNYFRTWQIKDDTGETYDVLLDGPKLRKMTPGILRGNTLPGKPPPDLVYDGGLHLRRLYEEGYLAPLDELLQTRGPNILRAYPSAVWEANKFEGMTMGIPLCRRLRRSYWVIRGDLRESVGAEPVRSHADLVRYAAVLIESGRVKKAAIASRSFDLTETLFADHGIRPTGVLPLPWLYIRDAQPATVLNAFDDRLPELPSVIETLAAARLQGLFQDGAGGGFSAELPVIGSGKWGALYHQEDGILSPHVIWLLESFRARTPGVRFELFSGEEASDRQVAILQSGGFLCLPAASTNHGVTIAFLDSLFQKTGHDMLHYGEQGTHWWPVGEDRYLPSTDTPYAPRGVITLLLPLLDLSPSPLLRRRYAGFEGASDVAPTGFGGMSGSYSAHPLAGFHWYNTPSLRDLAEEFNSDYAVRAGDMVTGALPAEGNWHRLEQDAAPLVRRTQTVLQEQIDAFLSKGHGLPTPLDAFYWGDSR